MQTKAKGLITLLLLLYSLNHSSQSDFRRAYIVTTDNDTIHGLVDYGNPTRNAKECYFKKDSLSSVRKYLPEELNAYAIINKHHYVPKILPFANENKLVFAEYLLHGVISLYYCRLPGSEHFFIEKEGNLYELTNKKQITSSGHKKYMTSSNQYIGILNMLMQDANIPTNELQRVQLNHLSLINTAQVYHDKVCNDEKCVIYYKEDKVINTAKWQISYGISIEHVWSNVLMKNEIKSSSSVNNEGEYVKTYEILEAHAKNNTPVNTIVPGLFINFNRNRKASFQLELKYQQIKHNSFNFQELKLPALLNLDLLLHKKVIPFISCGIDFNYLLNSEFHNPQTIYRKQIYDQDNTPLYSLRKSELTFHDSNNKLNLGVSIGMGVRYFFKKNRAIKLEGRLSTHTRNYFFTLDNEQDREVRMKLNLTNLATILSFSF